MQSELEALQHWYESQCDGDWEHEFGVKIGTLDNPGWMVDISRILRVFLDWAHGEQGQPTSATV